LKVLTPDERRRCLPFAFKPVVEDSSSPDSFLDKNIMELMCKKDSLGKMPMIMGYNSAEGLAIVLKAKQKLEAYEDDLARMVPRNMVVDPKAPEAQEAASDIRAFFFNGQALTKETMDNHRKVGSPSKSPRMASPSNWTVYL